MTSTPTVSPSPLPPSPPPSLPPFPLNRQDLLRAALSDKDSKMASLEGRWLQKGQSQVAGQLACLRVEREELVTELKRLHQQSMVVRRLVRKESSSELYQKCRGASREQVGGVCGVM